MARRKKSDYVVHLTPLTGMIASVRIAKFLSERLKLPVITNGLECANAVEDGIENLIVVNGPPAFCNFRDMLARAFAAARTVVWCQNDYTIYPPSQTNVVSRKRRWVNERGQIRLPHVWSTIPDRADVYVNWNALTLSERLRPLTGGKLGRRGLLYYGAFREGREERFAQYLPRKGLTISAPTAAAKRFRALLGDEVKIVPPFDDVTDALTEYCAVILMQDKRSDRRFMSLPNRFYEALSAGTAQLIVPDMIPSLEQAGYSVDPAWAWHGAEGPSWRVCLQIATDQRRAWARRAKADRANMETAVTEAYRKLRRAK